MRAGGAPFRFLAVVALGWIGVRIVLLWPQAGSLPAVIKALVPLAPAAAMPASGPDPPAEPTPVRIAGTPRSVAASSRPLALLPDPLPLQMAPRALLPYRASERLVAAPPVGVPLTAAPERIDPLPDRWSASGWLVARAGRGIGAAPGGSQLGGSQGGVRIAYLLAPRARIAAFARLTAPLAGKGREAAAGLEWQPTRLAVRLVAEQRFGLDGTPGGTGLGLVGGLYQGAAGFRLEAYGQAGAIARQRIEPYADGAARVTRGIAGSAVRLSLGAGIWGAAQRDSGRLDIGPSAVLAFDTVRVSLDWRQRIAGHARPGSGLALTLGGDF